MYLYAPRRLTILPKTGGTGECQKEFVESLNLGRKKGEKKPPIANAFALGYTYLDVLDTDQEGSFSRADFSGETWLLTIVLSRGNRCRCPPRPISRLEARTCVHADTQVPIYSSYDIGYAYSDITGLEEAVGLDEAVENVG